MIYLDHAAATPIAPKVLKVMQPYFSDDFFNPSSPYLPAVLVKRAYENARHDLAKLIGAKTDEVIITAGATESINLAFSAIKGHVITTNIEHHSVLNCAKNHDHTLIEVDKYGQVSPDDVKNAIKPETELISIALANNEIGTIQPISKIAEIVKNERRNRLENGNKTSIYLHCDASQGVGQIDINVARFGVDLLTLNAGKIYGPKQVGLLYVASHVKLEAQILGGGQERGLRSGTENIAGAIGFAKALELVSRIRKSEAKRLFKLKSYLETELTREFPHMIVSGHPKNQLAGHLHVSFPGLDGERLVILLERQNVLVATGSACAANFNNRSHVLKAIGLSDSEADGSIRITLGHLNNDENIKKAAEILIREIKKEYMRVKR